MELDVIILDLFQPFPCILVLTVHVVDLLVAEDDVEDRGDEHKGAHESFSLQLLDREEGHHADLIGYNDEEGRVGRCLDQLTLRVNLFPVHIQQVQAVNHVAQHAEKGSCQSDKRDGSTEKDANRHNCQRLGIEVPIVEVVLLLPEPGFKVLIDLPSHIRKPW